MQDRRHSRPVRKARRHLATQNAAASEKATRQSVSTDPVHGAGGAKARAGKRSALSGAARLHEDGTPAPGTRPLAANRRRQDLRFRNSGLLRKEFQELRAGFVPAPRQTDTPKDGATPEEMQKQREASTAAMKRVADDLRARAEKGEEFDKLQKDAYDQAG